MALRACFLSSLVGTRHAHAKNQWLLGCQAHTFGPCFAKRKRTTLRCVQEQEHQEGRHVNLDAEVKDILNPSMPDGSVDPRIVQDSDRQVVDEIAESGVKEIEDIAKDAKSDLADLQHSVKENAERLIEEETQAVLEKYDQKQEELLGNVKRDQEIISNEMELIKELAGSVKSSQGGQRAQTLREMVYFLLATVFAVSALSYACKGLVDPDSSALTNATIDTVFAAAAIFLYSREKRKR